MENGLFSIDLTTHAVEEIKLFSAKLGYQYAIRALLAEGNIPWVGTAGAGLMRLNTGKVRYLMIVAIAYTFLRYRTYNLKNGRLYLKKSLQDKIMR